MQYTSPGHLYCRCGTSLLQSHEDPEAREQVRQLNMERYECLTTSWFVLKEMPLRGRRYTQSPEQEARCRAKKTFTKARSEKSQDRLLKDDAYRESQLAVGWPSETCMKLDRLEQEDHSYVAFRRERERFVTMWAFSQSSSGSQITATDRGDYQAVVSEFRNAVMSSKAKYPQFYQPFHNAAAAKAGTATTAAAKFKFCFCSTGLGRADALCPNTEASQQSWWSSSNWWRRRQSWHSSFFLKIFEGVSLMRDSDLNMSNGSINTTQLVTVLSTQHFPRATFPWLKTSTPPSQSLVCRLMAP